MRETTLDVAYGRVDVELVPRLRGRVFHVTCATTIDAIRRTGAIIPNAQGTREAAFTPAELSCCRRRGAVSVFDYRAVTDEQLARALQNCAPYLPSRRCGFELAVFFLTAAAHAALETWDQIPPDERNHGMIVPHVEACHPGRIALTEIDEVLRVHISQPPSHPFLEALLQRGRS